MSKITLSQEFENSYTEKLVKQEGKKDRLIEIPKPNLRRIHKRIEDLLKRIKLPNYIHAPGKGRSYVTNAASHDHTLVVRGLDIRNYFVSIPRRKIYFFFYRIMNCSSDVAAILARICTFNDHLPTGSPLSPLLSYFANLDMWQRIAKILEDHSCTLTIYMDDITISGKDVPGKLVWEIKKLLHGNGLKDNRKKEKLYINKTCEITGVIKTLSGELKLPNRQHQKIRDKKREISRIDREIKKAVDQDTVANFINVKQKLKQQLDGQIAQKEYIEKYNKILQSSKDLEL